MGDHDEDLIFKNVEAFLVVIFSISIKLSHVRRLTWRKWNIPYHTESIWWWMLYQRIYKWMIHVCVHQFIVNLMLSLAQQHTHNSPLWVSYGASLKGVVENINCVITGAYCMEWYQLIKRYSHVLIRSHDDVLSIKVTSHQRSALLSFC